MPDVAPAPGTVTTWTAGLATLAFEPSPERPISTPTPMASSSVPMPAITVLLIDTRVRPDGGVRAGRLLRALHKALGNGSRGAPQR